MAFLYRFVLMEMGGNNDISNSRCVLDVKSPCIGWGIFHVTDTSLSLLPSFLPECSMEVSPVREGEGGRGCGYVCKLETPTGERVIMENVAHRPKKLPWKE